MTEEAAVPVAESTEASTTETAAVEQSPAEQTTEQAQASVSAGYNRVPGQAPEVPAENEPPEVHLVAGMPEEEVASRLKKIDDMEGKFNERLQKVNNQLGNILQRLDAIPKDAPRSEVRAIKSDSMKKLKELGFDELADALAEDLNGQFTTSQPAQSVDVEGVFTTRTRERAITELDEIHPDRMEIIKSPEYTEWLETMDEGNRNRFLNSESVVFVARGYDQFKDWRQAKANREATARNTSEARLKNAVPATNGKAASTPSRVPDEAGLWAGYNKGHKPFKR